MTHSLGPTVAAQNDDVWSAPAGQSRQASICVHGGTGGSQSSLDALELVGLFVEEADLFRAVRLPVFKEVSLTAEVLESNHDRLPRDIDGELRRLSVNFETAMRAFRYRCHVEVVRSHWLDTLSEVAKQFALVLVSRTARASGLRHRTVPEFQWLLKAGRTGVY